MEKSVNKFVRKDQRMIVFSKKSYTILMVLLFIGGCSKTINVTKDIQLSSNDNRTVTIIAKGTVLIDKVYDIWFERNYLYGFYYEKNIYLMFLLDIEKFDLVKGEEARNRIYELQLPVSQWTNYPELSGDFVSDESRRDCFLESLNINSF